MTSTRIFFSADVHGSERVFMKFLNASKLYKVDAVILGGDLTGKLVIPIIQQANGTSTCEFMGAERVVKKDDLEALEKDIRFAGQYPYRTTRSEFEELRADESKVDKLFTKMMAETFGRWLALAADRLEETGVECFMLPGNDDRLKIDEEFKKQNFVVNPEGEVVRIKSRYEMVSSGYTNVTPWAAPRDVPEEDLLRRIEAMAGKIESMETCIFNLHCPPYDTKLDTAMQLDSQLRPVIEVAGGPKMIPAGSIAVRQAIEKYQPLLGLHGHIHESRGVDRIGRTLCLNPGSEYAEGILRGAIITLDGSKVKSYQLTSG
jgi:Icc-related predicted phosphoesterase